MVYLQSQSLPGIQSFLSLNSACSAATRSTKPDRWRAGQAAKKPGRETSEAAKASNKHHTQQGDVWSSERIIRVSFAHCTTALFRALFLPALLMTTHRQPRSVTLSHSCCGFIDNQSTGEYQKSRPDYSINAFSNGTKPVVSSSHRWYPNSYWQNWSSSKKLTVKRISFS